MEESIPYVFYLLVTTGFPWLVATSLQYPPRSTYHLSPFLYKQLLLCLSLTSAPVVALTGGLSPLKCSVIIFAETLFLGKIRFTGYRELGGGFIQLYSRKVT